MIREHTHRQMSLYTRLCNTQLTDQWFNFWIQVLYRAARFGFKSWVDRGWYFIFKFIQKARFLMTRCIFVTTLQNRHHEMQNNPSMCVLCTIRMDTIASSLLPCFYTVSLYNCHKLSMIYQRSHIMYNVQVKGTFRDQHTQFS